MIKCVLELCFIQHNHVHQDGLHVHGDFKMGNKFAFATHLDEGFCDGTIKAMSQIMAKHRQHLKQSS